MSPPSRHINLDMRYRQYGVYVPVPRPQRTLLGTLIWAKLATRLRHRNHLNPNQTATAPAHESALPLENASATRNPMA